MSETGSAPASGEGSGNNSSGGGQTNDPGKTGAVQEVATNEALLKKIVPDLIGVICDNLDQQSRLNMLSANRASSKIERIRQKTEGEAEARALQFLKQRGDISNNTLSSYLNEHYESTYIYENAEKMPNDPTKLVNEVLGGNGAGVPDVINFGSALHVSALAACRLDANYKPVFEAMIDTALPHFNSLLHPAGVPGVTASQKEHLRTIRAQLATIRQKLQDMRTLQGPAGSHKSASK